MKSEFSKKFSNWWGQPLPDDYIVFDCETTGLDKSQDLPWQIGHCIVRDRQVVHKGDWILNWVGWPGIEDEWLEERIDVVTRAMAAKGSRFPLSMHRLRTEGRPPEEILKFYHEMFITNRKTNGVVVAHNGWSFDSIIIPNAMAEACGIEFAFMEDELFDTGCMEKAIRGDLHPTSADRSLKDFFLRVHRRRVPGVKWSTSACVERYGLAEKYNIKTQDLHSAAADCYVAHILLEEQREATFGS